MSLITPGRIYGIIAALALLAFFVVPLQVELIGTACSILSFAPTGCEVGVRGFLRGAVFYCLIAGYLISRVLDREPVVGPWTAPIVAGAAVILFALPLWIGLRAAFY
jgi:CBS-domain-containing membrane protein